MTTQTKAGFIAIIGAPNAGKSTLLNQILGQHLAIVSPKIHTTRFALRGIHTTDDTQYIFVDTPGIHQPRRGFDKAMVATAHDAWQEADVILLMIDAHKGFNAQVDVILQALEGCKKPIVLGLNKIDQIKQKEKLLPLMAKAQELGIFAEVFPISADRGQGVDKLLIGLRKFLPESPLLYSPNQVTDLPLHLQLAEITREQAFLQLNQELPYSVAIENLTVQDDGKTIHVQQNILVQRDSQKAIVLGNKGAKIQSIASKARTAMEQIFEKQVFLELHVKVKKDWDSDKWLRTALGL